MEKVTGHEIYRVFQKFVPLLCKSVVYLTIVLVKQIIYAKSCLFQSDKVLYIFCAIFFIGIFNFCIFSPKCVHARLYFPAKYLSYFVSWIAHNLSSVLWISWKMHPVNAKKLSYLRAQASINLLVCQLKKFRKAEKIWTLGSEMVVRKWWVWRQEKNGKTENP